MSKGNENRNDENNIVKKISKDVRHYAKIDQQSYKKEKKKEGVYFDGKKELKHAFYAYQLDVLPDAIDAMCKYGHIKSDEIQIIKNGIYSKIADPDFVKYLRKEIKEGNKIKNLKLLPIIISEILREANRANAERLRDDPNADTYDVSDLVKLSQDILKKPLKKFEKASIGSSLAFDILSNIPCPAAFSYSYNYKIKTFFDVLYEHAKSEAIPFEKILSIVVPDEWINAVLIFALLERKEKFSKLTDAQKTLYLSISNWCFDSLESMTKNDMKKVINIYINTRRKDDAAGRDGNRRYQLSSLSPTDYKKISEVVNVLIAENEGNKKYL